MSESLEPELFSSCKCRAGASGSPTSFKPLILSERNDQNDNTIRIRQKGRKATKNVLRLFMQQFECGFHD